MSKTNSIRGGQLTALRKLTIRPFVDRYGASVSGAAMKSVLRTIDDHGAKCWASLATIARETGHNEKTIRRSLKALEALGLVIITANHGRTSHYEINWVALGTPDTMSTPPDTLSRVANGPTPDTMSRTPDIMSKGSGHCVQNPGHSVHRSVKKRHRTEKNRESIVADRDEESFGLASLMADLVKQVAPKEKPPNLDKWSRTIRLMRDRDGHTFAEIEKVFRWANADPFWRTNIRCPGKLREKFGALHAKMSFPVTGYAKPPANVGPGVNFDPLANAGGTF